MNEIKLKPCPFCGGKARLLSEMRFGKQKKVWFVACGGLGCGVMPETIDADTPQEAAEIWNRRAGEVRPNELRD